MFRQTLRELAPAFVVAFLFCLFFSPGNIRFETPVTPTIDNIVRYGRVGIEESALASEALDSAARTSIANGQFRKGIDGSYYPVHELGSTLAVLPVSIVVSALPIHSKRKQLLELAFCFQGAVYAGTTAALFWFYLVRLLGVRRRQAMLATLGLSLGTQLLLYGGNAVDVMLAAPILLGCVVLLTSFGRTATLGKGAALGLLAGLLPVVKLTLLTMTGTASLAWLFILVGIRKQRPSTSFAAHAASYALGLAPGALTAMAYNRVRTGNIFASAYSWQMGSAYSLHRMLTDGFPGTFVSPGKGMLVFSPILVFVPWAFYQCWRRRPQMRPELLASVGGFLASVIWLSGCWFWTSLGGWGIRYYVPYLPVLVLPIACSFAWMSTAARRAAVGLFVVGFILNASGAVTNYVGQSCFAGDFVRPWEVYNTPLHSLISAGRNLERLFGASVPLGRCPEASEISALASNHLYTWWYSIRYYGMPPALSNVLGFGLGSMALLAAILWGHRTRETAAAPDRRD